MSAPKPSFADRARASWGTGGPPDWIVVLADEVDRASQTVVAKRLGYSSSVVSQTLNACYRGDLKSFEAAVRGALMGATLKCPVLGEIAKDHCLEEQKIAKAATSGLRMQIARACKTCPHSRQRADK